MSSSNLPPVTAVTTPFVQTTTENIARANRLLSARDNPGFVDILRISKALATEANDVLLDYGGWDPEQIMVLKARAQAAKEHHALLIARINEAIELGIAEQRALTNSVSEKTAVDAIEQGDYVRQQVLMRFKDLDENRVAGSYDPEDVR